MLNPSPKQGGIIGGIRIGVSSEYPKVGEIFCAQLRISMLFAGNKAPKPGDKVELMYSLTGSDGISVGVLPEIPSRGYLDREEVIITLPLRVTNEDFQLLKLNVCAYVNGDLTDWDWDSVRLNLHTPGYEKLGHIDGREIDDGWKTRLKGKDVAIVDPDGQLIDLGAIGIAAKKP